MWRKDDSRWKVRSDGWELRTEKAGGRELVLPDPEVTASWLDPYVVTEEHIIYTWDTVYGYL